MSTELAADLAEVQRARFDRMWATLSQRQRRLVEKALKKFEVDLSKTRRGSWGAASKAQTIVQVAQAVRGLSSSQLQSLRRALPNVAERAQASTADWLRILDESFTGSVQPLRWDSLEWLEQERRPLLRSRLQIYRKSFQRYGAEAVAAIESEVVERILTGDSWTDARESVMEIVREQVEGRTWMVDRIIRTESSAVWNGITMAALEAEDADDPDQADPMLKKLVATFDAVTAEDSRLLHGQTRRLDELFLDVTSGREYMAPPNRPNDREIVVGWRRSWGDDREFDQETAEETGGGDEQMTQAELDAMAAEAVAAAAPQLRDAESLIASTPQTQLAWEQSMLDDENDYELGAIRGWSGWQFGDMREADASGQPRTGMLKDMYSAMGRAPKYEGPAYRGISGLDAGGIASTTTPGAVIEFDAVSSLSKSRAIAEEFAVDGFTGGQDGEFVLWEFDLVADDGGVDITNLSKLENQKEVVVPRGARWEVVSRTPITKRGQSGYVVKLKRAE